MLISASCRHCKAIPQLLSIIRVDVEAWVTVENWLLWCSPVLTIECQALGLGLQLRVIDFLRACPLSNSIHIQEVSALQNDCCLLLRVTAEISSLNSFYLWEVRAFVEVIIHVEAFIGRDYSGQCFDYVISFRILVELQLASFWRKLVYVFVVWLTDNLLFWELLYQVVWRIGDLLVFECKLPVLFCIHFMQIFCQMGQVYLVFCFFLGWVCCLTIYFIVDLWLSLCWRGNLRQKCLFLLFFYVLFYVLVYFLL